MYLNYSMNNSRKEMEFLPSPNNIILQIPSSLQSKLTQPNQSEISPSSRLKNDRIRNIYRIGTRNYL